MKDAGIPATAAKAQKELAGEIAGHLNGIKAAVDKMVVAVEGTHKGKTTADHSKAYCDKVKPFFDVIRGHVDALEAIVDDNVWPLPKYREMLFIR